MSARIRPLACLVSGFGIYGISEEMVRHRCLFNDIKQTPVLLCYVDIICYYDIIMV